MTLKSSIYFVLVFWLLGCSELSIQENYSHDYVEDTLASSKTLDSNSDIASSLENFIFLLEEYRTSLFYKDFIWNLNEVMRSKSIVHEISVLSLEEKAVGKYSDKFISKFEQLSTEFYELENFKKVPNCW